MKEYRVEVNQILSKIVPVKAESKERAIEIIEEMYRNEDIQFWYDDFMGLECNFIEEDSE